MVRNLILVLGDQLSLDSEVFKGFDPDLDMVAMVEVLSEAKHVWSHKARIALFLSSMRHFAVQVEEKGFKLHYDQLTEKSTPSSFKVSFGKIVEMYSPQKIILIEPGEYRIFQELKQMAQDYSVTFEVRRDSSFLCSIQDFFVYSKDKKQIRMEFFYREMRRKYSILMEGKDPVGGTWNFDSENRKSFKKTGPEKIPFIHFKQDQITKEVIALVEVLFEDHPGSTENFDWPVTSEEARKCLDFFIEHLLPQFGNLQDAMWTDEAFLYHSRLSAALNLKLIHPLVVIKAAEQAYHNGDASLSSVEGFIRQILGWREYVRGVYHTLMPNYLERNFLNAEEDLPSFYWTGKTEMNCLKQVIHQSLAHGYAHHIQRLMVTGLFSLLYGVNPKRIHEWYLAIYVDAVEWVELPNTLGMSQYADGGVMASKPYIASGKYISRMSNYCKGCRYKPDESIGDCACPFTTLYWDFVRKHKTLLSKNPRLAMQVKNWDRISDENKKLIQQQSRELKKKIMKEEV